MKNKNFSVTGAILCAAALLTTPSRTQAATYAGNGATGFGGAVGTGSLAISDSLSGMTITLNRGTGQFNDDLVLYLGTGGTGFTDTSLFTDTADGGRTAISGFNSGNPSRTVASFPFAAQYALSMENGFIGAFQLTAAGSHTFLFGQSQSGNNSDASYTITISPGQMSQIGLTAGSGQTFSFDGTYISTSAYRSAETIGASTVPTPADGAGNAGFNGPLVFSQADTYTLLAIPEPATFALFGLGAAAILAYRRRQS